MTNAKAPKTTRAPKASKIAPEALEALEAQAPAVVNEKFIEAVSLLNSHKARLTPDIEPLFKGNSKFSFDAQTCDAGIEYGLDWSIMFTLPQKQIKRCVQLINAFKAANYENIDYTHARILVAMRLAGTYDLTTDAVIALASGARVPGVETRGVSVSAVNALFSRSHGVSTVSTKVSNSVGANGIYQVSGMTYGKPGTQNRVFSLNQKSPLVMRFFELLDKGTQTQLESIGKGDSH